MDTSQNNQQQADAQATVKPQGDQAGAQAQQTDSLEKVLENKAFWELPRIKELTQAAKEAKMLKTQQEKAAEEALMKEKKFEELANKRANEVQTLTQQLQEFRINQQLVNKLVPLGVIDLDGALKIIDRNKITMDDNGVIQNVDDFVKTFKQEKPYLFGTSNTTQSIGTAHNNTQTQKSGVTRFKQSQLNDHEFYKAHEKEINEAAKLGLIEMDA